MKRIIYDYENPHIVGRAKRSFSLAKIIVCVIAISLVLALIYILFIKDVYIKCETKEYFALVAERYRTETEALSAAKVISDKGGGGYVAVGASFGVIASVYESREDAEKVAKRYGWEVESIGKYIIKVDGVSKEALELFVYPEQIIDELYDISIMADKGEVSESAAEYALKTLDDQLKVKADKLNEIGKSLTDGKITELAAEMYSAISDSLSAPKNAMITSRVKYCLCEVTFTYKKFLIEIS